MFEQASKNKYRFPTNAVGVITVEDLWDLPLSGKSTSLDSVAKILNKALKENEEESFVAVRSVTNNTLIEKFDIVKHVIKVKLEENEKSLNAVAVKKQKEKIMSIIASKENAELEGLDLDALKDMVSKL